MFTNLATIRRRNLIALQLSPKQLAQSCGGQSKSWANVLSSSDKPFGEKKARHIEACLNLNLGHLDRPVVGIEQTTLEKVQKRVQRSRTTPVARNSAHAIMTHGQFAAITNLLGSHEPTRTAASMVLVEGWRIVDAAAAVNTSRSVVGRMVRRMQEAHILLSKAYRDAQPEI
nr:hypothetical protein [uncultured Rhodoferax sp.]